MYTDFSNRTHGINSRQIHSTSNLFDDLFVVSGTVRVVLELLEK